VKQTLNPPSSGSCRSTAWQALNPDAARQAVRRPNVVDAVADR
jgi:hypothetical protein